MVSKMECLSSACICLLSCNMQTWYTKNTCSWQQMEVLEWWRSA